VAVSCGCLDGGALRKQLELGEIDHALGDLVERMLAERVEEDRELPAQIRRRLGRHAGLQAPVVELARRVDAVGRRGLGARRRDRARHRRPRCPLAVVDAAHQGVAQMRQAGLGEVALVAERFGEALPVEHELHDPRALPGPMQVSGARAG